MEQKGIRAKENFTILEKNCGIFLLETLTILSKKF